MPPEAFGESSAIDWNELPLMERLQRRMKQLPDEKLLPLKRSAESYVPEDHLRTSTIFNDAPNSVAQQPSLETVSTRCKPSEVYCICRRPYEDGLVMVGCDSCNGWFHPACVGISDQIAEELEFYHCPACQASMCPAVDTIPRGCIRIKTKRKALDQNKKVRFAEGTATQDGTSAARLHKQARLLSMQQMEQAQSH